LVLRALIALIAEAVLTVAVAVAVLAVDFLNLIRVSTGGGPLTQKTTEAAIKETKAV
jgi:hypothetical protein